MSYALTDTLIASTQAFQVTGIQDPITGIGWIEFQNESSYSLLVQMGAMQFQIPAWFGWPVRVQPAGAPAGGLYGLPVEVQPKVIVNYQATAPGNTLSVIVYRLGETPANTAPYPLVRQTNVGNTVPLGSQATQVINTGNSAPTVVLSGTPSGAGSPEAVINNDGSATLGGGNFAMNAAGVVTAIPSGSIPASGIGSGYPAASVGSGYPAANVGNGNLGTGVLIGPGGGKQTGYGINGGAADGLTTPNTLEIGSGSLFEILVNCYKDNGGTYHFQTANPARRFFYDATSADPFFQSQVSTNTPSAGAAITWGTGGNMSSLWGISGSGSATVSHALGFTPFVALVNTTNGSNSTTFGSGSYTSTTVFIFQFNAQSWKGEVLL